MIPNKTSKSISFICILSSSVIEQNRLFQPTRREQLRVLHLGSPEAIGSSLGSGGCSVINDR